MSKSNKFSPEVRERAVRMVQEQRGEYPSLWAAIESIAPKIGCVPQTLNEWFKRAEVDAEAVNCRFSNFRKTRAPTTCDSVFDSRHGVSSTWLAKRCAAASTSERRAIVISFTRTRVVLGPPRSPSSSCGRSEASRRGG